MGRTFWGRIALAVALAGTLPAMAGAARGATAPEAHVEDRQLLMYAMGASLAQVRVGELAAEKSKDERVRRYARRLVDYHRDAGERLARIAGRYRIEPPEELDPVARGWFAKLGPLDGPAFDAGYLNGQVVYLYTARYAYRRGRLYGSDGALRREADRQADDVDGHRHEAQRLVPTLKVGPAAPGALHAEDRQFLLYAMDGDLSELRLAELAVERAQDERVRGFARHMVDYHTRGYDRVSAMAREHGVEPLREGGLMGQRTREHLEGLTGPRFDYEYITTMVIRHYSTFYRYERESIHGRNEALRQWGEEGSRDAKVQHDAARKIVREWSRAAPAALAASADGGGAASADRHAAR